MEKTGITLLVSAFIVMIVTITIAIIFGEPTKNNSQKDKKPVSWDKKENKIDASIAVKDLVKTKLKSPSTAEFQSQWDGLDIEDDITYLGAQKYRINSYVDAENEFGAKVRMQFTATIQQTSKDYWELISIDFK